MTEINRRGFFGSVAAFFSFLFGRKVEAGAKFKRTSVVFNGKIPEVKEIRWVHLVGLREVSEEEFVRKYKEHFAFMAGKLDAMGGLSGENNGK